jgi:hypothetical protein
MIWPYIIWSLVSILLLPAIERWRFNASYGKVVNLNKKITVAIAIAAWLIMCGFLGLYEWAVIFFALACFGIRGMFYDPSLNLFLGRYIDAESETTNSKTDKAERKLNIGFWWQRLIYLGIAVVFAVLYELTKLMNEV